MSSRRPRRRRSKVDGVINAYSSVFEWQVSNFSSYFHNRTDDSLLSPIFRTCSAPGAPVKWQLRLDFNCDGDLRESREFLSLFLCCRSRSREITAGVDFWLRSGDNFLVNSQEANQSFSFNAQNKVRGFKEYLRATHLTEKQSNLLANDTLKVFCGIILNKKFSYSLWDDDVARSYQQSQVALPERLQVLDDLEQLLESGKFSDIVFQVGSEQIRAHKSILASRSPVFAAMFEHDMKESQVNIVEIHDFDAQVMKNLLLFMYSGKLTKLNSIICDLMHAADKYGVKQLTDLCARRMLQLLCVDNALKYLIAAHLSSCTALKTDLIKFIVQHQKEIIDGPDYQSFVESQPHLACELFGDRIDS